MTPNTIALPCCWFMTADNIYSSLSSYAGSTRRGHRHWGDRGKIERAGELNSNRVDQEVICVKLGVETA